MITQEFYDEEDKIGWTSIWIYFKPFSSKIKDFYEGKSSGYIISDTPGCIILLDSRFWNDNMASKMEKALIHLVKLSGESAEITRSAY